MHETLRRIHAQRTDLRQLHDSADAYVRPSVDIGNATETVNSRHSGDRPFSLRSRHPSEEVQEFLLCKPASAK